MNFLRKTLPAIALLALGSGLLHGEPRWSDDLETAIAKAKQSGRKVLVNFTGSDWCGYCIKLKEQVLTTEAFAEWAGRKLVLVEIDFPRRKEQTADTKARNAALKQRFEVPGYPTVILLDGEGSLVHKEVGFAPGSSAEWMETMQNAAGAD